MPDLVIKFKKNADGSAALTCVRADGSSTWQQQTGAQGQFFPLHDLTHYAVETILRRRIGFYGLLADGWSITDFGKPWPRGPMPPDALVPELIVGFLDTERASGAVWTAEQFHENALRYFEQHDLSASFRLSDEELVSIRQRRAELFAQWAGVPAGGTLELAFDRAEFPD
jgi:hypothetical protein